MKRPYRRFYFLSPRSHGLAISTSCLACNFLLSLDQSSRSFHFSTHEYPSKLAMIECHFQWSPRGCASV